MFLFMDLRELRSVEFKNVVLFVFENGGVHKRLHGAIGRGVVRRFYGACCKSVHRRLHGAIVKGVQRRFSGV